jgi:hypothetical protein
MARFQKLIKNNFSPYTSTTYTFSSGYCPKFSSATSSSLLMLTAGPLDQFPGWRRGRRRLSVYSVLRCPDLWLQCSVFRARFKKSQSTRIMWRGGIDSLWKLDACVKAGVQIDLVCWWQHWESTCGVSAKSPQVSGLSKQGIWHAKNDAVEVVV